MCGMLNSKRRYTVLRSTIYHTVCNAPRGCSTYGRRSIFRVFDVFCILVKINFFSDNNELILGSSLSTSDFVSLEVRQVWSVEGSFAVCCSSVECG